MGLKNKSRFLTGLKLGPNSREKSSKLRYFYQFKSKLATTHTITIKWKEKYDAVVVDCHHSLHLCGDRRKMSCCY